MPKKRASTEPEQAPVSEDRPLHAPAFEAPALTPEPDDPQAADDTDTKDVS